MQVPAGISEHHGVEHLGIHLDTAVDSRLFLGQFIVVLNSLIALFDAGVMTWYVSHLPKLPS